MTLDNAYALFMRDRKTYCSPGTLKTYKGHMLYFIEFVESSFSCSFNQLTFEAIPDNFALFQEYIIYLQIEHSCKNVSIRSYCRVVKAFLKYCYELDYCKDYLKRVKFPKDDSSLHVPLFSEDVKRIDDVFCARSGSEKLQRNYCIFHLMLDCGLRSQEVRALRVEHINWEKNILSIINSKGMKSRLVLVPDFLLEEISLYLGARRSGVVFLDLKKKEALTSNAIKQLFSDLKEASRVGSLHAHLCRHTFATSYLVGGGNLEFLRALLGHYDYAVTKNYCSMAAQCKMLELDIYKLDPIFFTRGY